MSSVSFNRFVKGISLEPVSVDPIDNIEGSMWDNSSTHTIRAYVQGSIHDLVTADQTQTLTNKTFVAPNLGTPTVLIGTNITGTAPGLTAGSVTSIPNLSGDVTSVGNVTTIAATTNNTLVTLSSLSLPGSQLTGTTGSGNVVLATGASLVSPALGTPSSLVGTNITGTASGLTAGTVTTNANLTGDITSVGNATILATVNSNVGTFGSSTELASITVNAKGLITAASQSVLAAPAGTLTGTVLASNVVTSSLTTVATIATGVWNGTPISTTYGGTGATSALAGFNALSPMTSVGDIIYGGTGGSGTRLPVGSNGQVLVIASGIPSWGTVLTNPMTTGGDLIYGGSGGAPQRLANGSSGQVLTSQGSTNAPIWRTPAAIPTYNIASSGNNNFSANSTTFVLCGSCIITTTGGPVMVQMVPVTGSIGTNSAFYTNGTVAQLEILITMNSGGIASSLIGGSSILEYYPVSSGSTIDVSAIGVSGSRLYDMYIRMPQGSGSVGCQNVVLTAWELNA